MMADTTTTDGAGVESVRVNTDELEGIYQLMREQREVVNKELDTLKQLYEGLSELWAGEDYDAFKRQFEQDLPFVEGAYVALDDVVSEMEVVVKEYRRLESWIEASFAAVRDLQSA